MLALALALGASVAWGGSDFVAGLASRRMPLLAVLVVAEPAALGAGGAHLRLERAVA